MNTLREEIRLTRKTPYPLHPLLLERCSPRSMSGENLTDAELMTLFEAARWAPSSYNGQPWHFLYAKQGSAVWPSFFNLLVPFNQQWCAKAAVLLVVLSHKVFTKNGKPSRTHSFDTGAAWMALALEATHLNLVAHGMEGFDYERARRELHVPDDYAIEAMVALGRPAPQNALPAELAAKEVPSTREPVSAWIKEGVF